MGGKWRIRELLYLIVAHILLLGITAVIVLLGTSSGTSADAVERGLNNSEDNLFVVGRIFGVDIPSRTVTISWLVGGCGQLRLKLQDGFEGSGPCGVASIPLSIYVDGNLESSYDPVDLHPLGSGNATVFVQNQVQFVKTHTLDIQVAQLPGVNNVFDQAFYYPFDFYHATTSFFVLNANDNTSLPITRLVFTDSVDNFKPSSIESDTQTVFNGTLVQSRTTSLGLMRTTRAKLYTMVLFVVNWLLTLMVGYITLLTHLGEEFGEGIIVLPLTIILTLPQIRGLFVQDPPFGILLDSLGLVLQMIIVSMCSIAILLRSVAKYRPLPQKEDMKDE